MFIVNATIAPKHILCEAESFYSHNCEMTEFIKDTLNNSQLCLQESNKPVSYSPI